MSVLKTISQKFIQASERRAQRVARQQMLAMSDRQLADFGISRVMLLEGAPVWPWMDAPVEQQPTENIKRIPVVNPLDGVVTDAKVIKQAINELSAYSDRELVELGVARYSIGDAVRSGRHTVDSRDVA